MQSISEKINIIVPTYNDEVSLTNCLDAIAEQNFPMHLINVWVINNCPSSPLVLKNYSFKLNLISESKKGSYAARNAAIKCIENGLIIFTDSDCIPHTDWVRHIVDSSLSDNQILVGEIDIFKEEIGHKLVYQYEKLFSFNQYINSKKSRSVTANMACNKLVFEKIGLFDDNLLSGGDFEWSKRACFAGLKFIYCGKAKISHPARKNISSLLRKTRRIARSGMSLTKTRETPVFFFIISVFKLPYKKLKDVFLSNNDFWTKLKLCMLVILIHEYDIYQRLLYRIGVAESVRE